MQNSPISTSQIIFYYKVFTFNKFSYNYCWCGGEVGKIYLKNISLLHYYFCVEGGGGERIYFKKNVFIITVCAEEKGDVIYLIKYL